MMNCFSIIIPAYDEEKLIGNRIKNLLEPLAPNCNEIIIVCNGCTDATAAQARKIINQLAINSEHDCHINVVELDIGSKINALNHGINISKNPISVVLDADIEISSADCAELVNFMNNNNLLAASPTPKFNYKQANWLNKRFYKIVSSSTYNKEHRIANVIALSAEAKTKLFPLPNVIADDAYIQRTIGKSDYKLLNTINYTFNCPRTILAMLKVQSRIVRGNLELKSKYPNLIAPKSKVSKSSAIDRAIFITIKTTAHIIARLELLFNVKKWHKDDSSR